jgi:PncC family amidohydrolase
MNTMTDLVALLKEKGLIITFVESCTGGHLANALTDVPGSSDVFRGSFVTYSNKAKLRLGVSPAVIEKYSVYSEECAREMASAGLLESAGAQVSVAVSGSLSREDPQNLGASRTGEVFIGFSSWKQPNESIKIEVKAQSRPEAKAEVLQAVLDFVIPKI